ncbi:MAG: TIGR01459 family HAD-type hydrolase [Hyphomicrobium sp.]
MTFGDVTAGIVPGLRVLAQRYDALILDLWGVLHDGVRPYPWVIPCLEALRASGKALCVLSNAPRRVSRIAAHMAEMGLPPALIDVIYSSGEATFEALTTGPGASPLDPFGRRCLHIGRAADARLVSKTDIRLVSDPAEVDFVLCTGVKTVDDRLEDYQGVLRQCLRHGLPLVCANPDLEVMQGDRIKLCAGSLAAFYEGEGGRVVSYGKPHRPVYDRCLEILSSHWGSRRDRVLAVGDSFRTDVAGANGAGIDCLLIAAGLDAEILLTPDGAVDAAALDRLAAEWRHRPRWTAARFEW